MVHFPVAPSLPQSATCSVQSTANDKVLYSRSAVGPCVSSTWESAMEGDGAEGGVEAVSLPFGHDSLI